MACWVNFRPPDVASRLWRAGRLGKGRPPVGLTLVVLLAAWQLGTSSANLVAKPQQLVDRSTQDTGEACSWVFESYEPSEWESEWRRGEESGERKNRECEVLAEPKEVRRSVDLIRATTGLVLNEQPIPPDLVALFSRMVYSRRCGPDLRDTGQRRTQLIEPLIGILRDPLTICPLPPGVDQEVARAFGSGEGAIQSKRHLLIGPAAPWSDTPGDPQSWRVGGFEPWGADRTIGSEPRARLKILMDLGASLYEGWKKDPTSVGASWFVDRYKRHQVLFDWIVSFEIEKHDPDQIYRKVPDEILPHYIYFNQGVEKDPDGKWNPWRILKGMGTTSNDYVVVKLDIDAPDIENPLMDQLRNDVQVRSLVDEIFMEHHVSIRAMWGYWGTKNSPLTLKDSYRMFADLRSKGVRMHSWP